MRVALVSGFAVAVLASVLALAPAAGAGDRDDGLRSLERAGLTAASGPGKAEPGERIQRALQACVTLGFRSGSREQRACAERILGVPPAGGEQPAGDAGQPGGRVVPPRPPQPSGPVLSDQGIVQGVAGDQILLRALDGASIGVPFDVRTKFYVGDRAGTLADVVPGVVATIRHQSHGIAIDVRIAVAPKAKLRIDRGITESAGPTAIIITLRNGSSRIIAIGGTTRVFAPNGRQVGAEALRSGLLVDVLYDPSGTTPAQSVKIIRRV
jgi:hypothetical protein